MIERKVLVTLLGRSDKKDGGYRKTSYRFPDGFVCDPIAFLGWELRQRVLPDKIVVLGTSGSMWDWLIEPIASLDQDKYLSLIEAVDAKHATKEQLQFFAPKLSEVLGTQIDLEIISDSQTEEEQLTLLTQIAPLIEDGDRLTLDLTHGYRHLPNLLLMAVVYLRSIRSIAVQAVYSSFYDADSQKGIVFDMSGLLKLFDWHSALNAFAKDGDPGVFAALFKNDGCSKNGRQKLREASYLSRVHRHEEAWKAECAFADELGLGKVKGVGGLFAPYLKTRLGSEVESDGAKRLARMARKQLALGSFDRAALLGLLAAQTQLALRNETLKFVHSEMMASRRGTESVLGAYRLLYAIRNSIAHTNDNAQNSEAERILSNEESLRVGMKTIFDILLAS